ncbi:cytochrome P450 [Kitasatospora sp. NPDC096204]|uniref:cytochrome P450 n=1 Tax=Kitasatospora sp. NPDC096204 TaxID=3364094 RepID=UPI0037F9FB0A
MTARAPHRQNARLRAAGPAVRAELPDGITAWSVTRGSVIRALAGDPRISREPRRHRPGLAAVPEGWPMGPLALQQNFFNLYGDEHRSGRRRMTPSFSPRRVAALRPGIEATTADLVAALRDLGPDGAVDVRLALSRPLTMTVICDLFGVPADLRPRIGGAMDIMVTTTTTTEQTAPHRARIDVAPAELLDRKRREPGPDLASDVAAVATGEGTGQSEQESRDTLFLMLGVGYKTAVIRRGESILLGFGAAGRDPQLQPDRPDDFDPTRPSKEHLAFGHGPHFCLGAPLARLKAEVALDGLFSAYPGTGLDPSRPAPARMEPAVVNGPAELWIVPEPAAAAPAP